MQFLFFKNYQSQLLLLCTLALFIPPLAMQIQFHNEKSKKEENFVLPSTDPCNDYFNTACTVFTIIIFITYILAKYTNCFNTFGKIVLCCLVVLYGIFLYFRMKSIDLTLSRLFLCTALISTIIIIGLCLYVEKQIGARNADIQQIKNTQRNNTQNIDANIRQQININDNNSTTRQHQRQLDNNNSTTTQRHQLDNIKTNNNP